MTSLQDLL